MEWSNEKQLYRITGTDVYVKTYSEYKKWLDDKKMTQDQTKAVVEATEKDFREKKQDAVKEKITWVK